MRLTILIIALALFSCKKEKPIDTIKTPDATITLISSAEEGFQFNSSGGITQATYRFTFYVKAGERDLYISQFVDRGLNVTGNKSIAMQLERQDGIDNTSGVSAVLTDDNADSPPYRIDAHSKTMFTLTVFLHAPAASGKFYRIRLNEIKIFFDQNLTDGKVIAVEDFITEYLYVVI